MLSKGTRRVAERLASSRANRCVCNDAVNGKAIGIAEAPKKESDKSEIRLNSMGIQMLPPRLHQQIFPNATDTSKDEALSLKRKSSVERLKQFGLWGKNSEILPNVEFDLPKLEGSNIDEHFKSIATEQCGAYVNEVFRLCSTSLPEKPKTWSKEPGWTKYLKLSSPHSQWEPVKFPDERVLVFDCEVLVTEGEFPVMAVAVSPTHWYSWCSPRVFQPQHVGESGIGLLIPMEQRPTGSLDPDPTSRVIIGHNVSYDRARIREQYYIEESGIRFIDTMSMHIAISGFSSYQRNLYMSNGKKEVEGNSSWLGAGSMNNLSDVHRFYCGSSLEKTTRNVFVTGTMDDVRNNFVDLIEYCSNDVNATYNILKKIFPVFCQRFPHPVTMAAMLEMGMMYLPTNQSWPRFVQNADNTYNDLDKELKSTLIDVADKACGLIHEEKYKSDPWLNNLDWTKRDYKLLKSPRKDWKMPEHTDTTAIEANTNLTEEEKEFLGTSSKKSPYTPSPIMQSILNTAISLPKIHAHMPGYPKWYSELCLKENDPNWKPGPVKLTTLTKITPKLLRMTWNNYRLHHDISVGWGYLVPKNEKHSNKDQATLPTLDDEIDSNLDLARERKFQPLTPIEVPGIPEGYLFYKLPHKLGYDYNVGNPLSHDFISKVEDGILKSADTKQASRCLEINLASSYWRGNQRRVRSQIYIKLPGNDVLFRVKNHLGYEEGNIGAILPITIVFGTVSRRAVETVWLTASNVRGKRIGSELKAMIQAPPGYSFVGADVDSQELWIASLLGDADFAKEHGCTPISWMTLQGTKSKGTDLHSKTADTIGITRDQAKAFNYARIYGSGQRLARHLLQQFNPSITAKEAEMRVSKLFRKTKGMRKYFLSMDGRYYANKLKVKINPSASRGGLVTYQEVKALENAVNYKYGHLIEIKTKDLVAGRVWDGGMESEMFNRLEKIARSMNPKTPVLYARISSALEPSKVQENFLPTRMNWVVQSSAVDYMHLMLVCMRWLIKKFSIKARFAISIHDELRYLCTEEDRYKTALALQISNILTRSIFAYKLGMEDLPIGVAFFSSVEIDKVLRKHHLDDCVTPSNPMGLEASCGIPPGVSLDIYEILNNTSGGTLEKYGATGS